MRLFWGDLFLEPFYLEAELLELLATIIDSSLEFGDVLLSESRLCRFIDEGFDGLFEALDFSKKLNVLIL